MMLQEACTRRILTIELVDRVAEYLRELEELPATAAAPALREG